MKIKITPKFQRKIKKLKGDNHYLKKLKTTIQMIEEDYLNPTLGTHKLSGSHKGYYSPSCGYDCRILFKIEEIDGDKIIILADFGKHDEVY